MSLRIAHLPNHGPSVTMKTIEMAGKIPFDSAGVSEGYKAVPLYRSHLRLKMKVFASSASKVDRYGRRPSYDNPILVADKHAIIDQGTYRVTNAMRRNLKWNPERWLNWVAYEHEVGQVCHITVHPNPNNQTWRYRKAMRALDRRIGLARASGYLVVVTGDLQTRDTHPLKSGGHDSLRPADVFARHGLKTIVEHLDWVAVDHRLRVTHVQVVPAADLTPGQDHPWIIVSAVLRPHGLASSPETH